MDASQSGTKGRGNLVLVSFLVFACAGAMLWSAAPGLHPVESTARDVRATAALGAAPSKPASERAHSALTASCAVGVTGAMRGLDERAMVIVRGVTLAAQGALPDPDAVLVAIDSYLKGQEAELTQLSAELKRIREGRTKEQIGAYLAGLRRRYQADVAQYERAMASFEQVASDAQIFELNALMRSLASTLGTE